MNTVKGVVIACAIVLMPVGVFAQSNYAPSGCLNLSRDLHRGMRGADVTELQRFLVGQNYPGGGSWMITGLFGAATEVATRNFQQVQGLSQIGSANAQTRGALSRLTCGNNQMPSYTPNYPLNQYSNQYPQYTPQYTPEYTPTNVWSGNYNYPNNYPSNYWYNNTTLNLTSLSANTGVPGTSITVYGTGFDSAGNTVYFGGYAVSNLPSNGESLIFTIPYISQSGTVNLYVTNSRGTSNSLTFTVYSSMYGCNAGSNYVCGCGYGYNCTPPQNNQNVNAPTINYLNPASGAIGSSVTIIGSGFTTTGNTVRFGTGIVADLRSQDGRSVSFTVPAQLVGYGTQRVAQGTYNVSVTNSAGYTTNIVPYSVTSIGTNTTPSLSYLSPTSGRVGTQVLLQGSGFTAYDNTIHFGVGGAARAASSNGTTLYFTVPSTLSPCDVLTTGSYCAQYLQSVTPGTYPVFVSNSSGSSNTLNFQVQ